ncbi:MAG TPA: SDR family oxidoreductase, partial [Euzebyales bacterium]|nr:SDR family oxidoreductase [Euzebyales bacterium]
MSEWGPFSLVGKSAIVTGGAMGIGLGCATWMARAGANVLIADVDGDAAEQATAQLGDEGGTADGITLDVTAADAGSRVVGACVDRYGAVDVLVNNAGIYPRVPMLEMERALFDRVYEINLKALAFCSKAAAALMKDHGRGGAIVNIASVDGFHPSMVGLAAYDASKGGVVMFTKSFALEMAPHKVRVNAIAPGGIDTPGTHQPLEGSGMTAEQMGAVRQGFLDTKIPMKRYGEPEDIGKVAVFLASDAASYVTGETVVVDGG